MLPTALYRLVLAEHWAWGQHMGGIFGSDLIEIVSYCLRGPPEKHERAVRTCDHDEKHGHYILDMSNDSALFMMRFSFAIGPKFF